MRKREDGSMELEKDKELTCWRKENRDYGIMNGKKFLQLEKKKMVNCWKDR